VPQLTEQRAVVAHVTSHAPSHLMSHDASSTHCSDPRRPMLILHSAFCSQRAEESSPALRSQFEVSVQTMVLSSPQLPLQSASSAHAIAVAPSPLALHFDVASQLRLQPAAHHVAVVVEIAAAHVGSDTRTISTGAVAIAERAELINHAASSVAPVQV